MSEFIDGKLFEIFFPTANQRMSEVSEDKDVGVVHYTSAHVAKSIFEEPHFWMRLASTMNDYREIEYGKECFDFARRTVGSKFDETLEKIAPGVAEKAVRFIEGWYQRLHANTYIACFSQHDYSRENEMGRLSMWRAYGGMESVALVLNKKIFFGTATNLRLIGSPVAYLSKEDFATKLSDVEGSVRVHSELLKSLDPQILFNNVLRMYRFGILSAKHPGFREEQEWRLIYSPDLDNLDGLSPLQHEIVSIGGVVQPIVKIPLELAVGRSETHCLADLFERIIIGPTPYSAALSSSFQKLFRDIGLLESDVRVVCSDIPFRR